MAKAKLPLAERTGKAIRKIDADHALIVEPPQGGNPYGFDHFQPIDVPNVVYTCGALLHGRELIIPYAMSDSTTSFASVSLDELLAAME